MVAAGVALFRPVGKKPLSAQANEIAAALGAADTRQAAIEAAGSLYRALAASPRTSRDEQLAHVIVLGVLVDAQMLDALAKDPEAEFAAAGAAVAAQGFEEVAAWFELQRYVHALGRRTATAAQGVAALRRVAALPAHCRTTQVQGILTLLVVHRCSAEWRWAAAQEAIAMLAESLATAPNAEWDVLLGSCRLQTFLRFGLADRALPELRRLEAQPIDSPLRPQVELDRITYWMATDAFANVRQRVDDLLAQGARPELAEEQRGMMRIARAMAASAMGDVAAAQRYLAELQGEPIPVEDRLLLANESMALALRSGTEPDYTSIRRLLGELDGTPLLDFDLRAARAGMALRAALHMADAVAVERAHRELATLFGDHLAAIAEMAPRVGGIGFLHFEELQQVVADLVDAELAIEPDQALAAAAALQQVLRAHAHGSLARSMGSMPATVAAVQAALAEHGAVVYVPSRYGSSLLLVDRRGVRHLRLPSRDTIDIAARALNTALASNGGDVGIRAVARALAAQLRVAEWLPQVRGWQAMWMIGGDLLGNAPIESLPAGDGDALLGELVPVTNLSSLTLAASFDARPATFGPVRRLALFATLAPAIAAADGKHDIQPYELTAADIAPLVRGFDAGAVTTDLRPTPRSVLTADLGAADVVHLFAHGVFDPAREMPAGIALQADADGRPGDDGVLWPELAAFTSPPRGLVVLSACGTGRANRRIGEDLAGNLGGVFLRANARGVVLSRARLQREWMVGLIGELQAQLQAGRIPVEALQRARVAHGQRVPAARFHDAQVQLFGGSR